MIRHLFALMCILPISVFAQNYGMDEGKEFAEQMNNSKVKGAESSVNPSSVPNYQGEDVSATQYYEAGGTIEDQARRRAVNDETAQFVIKGHNERPPVEIDRETDPLFANYERVAENAHSLTDSYSGCVELPVGDSENKPEVASCSITGEYSTHESICRRAYTAECRNDYFEPYSQDVAINVASRRIPSVTVVVDMRNGVWRKVDPESNSNRAYATLPVGVDYADVCEKRRTVISGPKISHWPAGVQHVGGVLDRTVIRTVLQSPTCENGLVAKLRIADDTPHDGTDAIAATFMFTFDYSPFCSPLYDESFQCPDIDGYSDNQFSGRTCVDSEPKNVGGFTVSRDCWLWEETYQKQKFSYKESPECLNLEAQGCGFLSQECSSTLPGGECSNVTRRYSCSTESDQTVTMCEKELQCQGGECAAEYNTPRDATEDFKKAATAMAVAKEIADEFDVDALSVFRGSDKKCKDQSLGFINCCSDSGWGADLGLAQCGQEAEELGIARQKKSTHYIGSYETGSWPSEREYEVYCVFPSKLARIVVEQGNLQLGRNYGTPEFPNCRGFTIEQLEGLDFEAMDLSEFYSDVMATAAGGDMPNLQNTIRDLEQKLENLGGGG